MLWLRYSTVQMVNSKNINEKMVKCAIWCISVLFTLLEVFVRTQISMRDTAHGNLPIISFDILPFEFIYFYLIMYFY